MSKPQHPPLLLGKHWGTADEVHLGYDQMAVHMAVLGGSGSGKSKFLEYAMRQMMIDGHGFCFIDPHGDTARDLLAFAAAKKALAAEGRPEGDDTIWRKVHYLKVSSDLAFSFDPFAILPKRTTIDPRRPDKVYQTLLDAKVDRVYKALMRRVDETDLEVMQRLQKWLKNLLYICGTSYDLNNSHIGLHKMLTFTDPGRPGFHESMEMVWPFLPDFVKTDFSKLIKTKNEMVKEKLESTDNRLRSTLSVLVRDVFGNNATPLNILDIIKNGDFIIADLGASPGWSHDQKVTLGGLLIDEVLIAKEAEENAPKEKRVPFALIIDESGEFLGEDLKRALGATRKYSLPIVLAAQDLSTFAKGDFDMAPKVLSMCGTVVCFQSTYRPDKEILADRVGAGDLDFTERLQLVQRQRGWIQVQTLDPSWSKGKSRGISLGVSENESESQNLVINETISSMRAFGTTSSWNNSHQQSKNKGDTHSTRDGYWSMMKPLSAQSGTSIGDTRGEGGGSSMTDSEGKSQGRSMGQTRGANRGRNMGLSASENESESWSKKTTFMPNIVDEYDRTGQLNAGSIADQAERIMQNIHCLSVAEAIVSKRNERNSVLLKVAPVEEWWPHPDMKEAAIERIIMRLREIRNYYFDPKSVPLDSISGEAYPFANFSGRRPTANEGDAEENLPENTID